MRNLTRTLMLLGVAGLAVGCAAAITPAMTNQMMTEAEMAVRRAESAGAPAAAPELMTAAQHALDEGRQVAVRGERERARERFLEARAYAEAAESHAKLRQLTDQVHQVRQETEALEAKTRELRSRAGQ